MAETIQPDPKALGRLRMVKLDFERLATSVPAQSRRDAVACSVLGHAWTQLPYMRWSGPIELKLCARLLKRIFLSDVYPAILKQLAVCSIDDDDAVGLWLAWQAAVRMTLPAWIGDQGVYFVQQHSARFLTAIYPQAVVTKVNVQLIRDQELKTRGKPDIVV